MATKGYLSSIIDVLNTNDITFKDQTVKSRMEDLLKAVDADLITQNYNPNDSVIKASEDLDKELESLYEFEDGVIARDENGETEAAEPEEDFEDHEAEKEEDDDDDDDETEEKEAIDPADLEE